MATRSGTLLAGKKAHNSQLMRKAIKHVLNFGPHPYPFSREQGARLVPLMACDDHCHWQANVKQHQAY